MFTVYLAYFPLKNESWAYKITSLSVSPTNNFEPTDKDFQQVDMPPSQHNFNPIPSTILKWWRFKLLRWMQNVHQSALVCQGLSMTPHITAVWQLSHTCGTMGSTV
jgi:hypothetical protein